MFVDVIKVNDNIIIKSSSNTEKI